MMTIFETELGVVADQRLAYQGAIDLSEVAMIGDGGKDGTWVVLRGGAGPFIVVASFPVLLEAWKKAVEPFKMELGTVQALEPIEARPMTFRLDPDNLAEILAAVAAIGETDLEAALETMAAGGGPLASGAQAALDDVRASKARQASRSPRG
jgi:hypothetical protein